MAIVQARMAATRLPGKVLLDIEGLPMLARVVDRVRASCVDDVGVATSIEQSDDAIADYCESQGISVFRGSLIDVLDRFRAAAEEFGAVQVVRVTADCPLTDPAVIDSVVRTLRSSRCDYATNTLRYSWPEGFDVEAFTREALERAWSEAHLPSEREHVTPYIRTAPGFRCRNVEAPIDQAMRGAKLSVDDERDLYLVRSIYARLSGRRGFGAGEVVDLLRKDSEMALSATCVIENEGYYRSLALDPVEPITRDLSGSFELRDRAEKMIPGGNQTFSKAPSQFVQGVSPVFAERAQGCSLWDVDGNEYIDLAMALGPVLLGYGHAGVSEAVTEQLRDGVVFSLPHRIEVEVAERLTEIIPCAEMVRFGKNGSDATAGAVRVARAYTGRDLVLTCGYHGWQDWYIGSTTRGGGVPKAVADLVRTFPYNDLGVLSALLEANVDRVACVILEPVGVEEPQPGFLEGVKDLTREAGALLIFDEIITGFRLALGGAQAHFGVVPDLAAFGKAMGNGFPISAVVGRRDVMALFDDVFFSFTFAGDAVALAAVRRTIEEIERSEVIPHVWEQGRRLRDGFNVLARDRGIGDVTRCVGLPPRTAVTFTPVPAGDELVLKSLFQQECIRRGVLFTGSHNVSAAHSSGIVDQVLRVYATAMRILAESIEAGSVASRLEGPPVEAVFRLP